jgi:uncharacterized phage protein (TIGR01671 family)
MRPIKFRAWDTSDRIWLDASNNRLTLDGSSLLDANGWPWAIPGRVIIEQFTGLHDKNGREIYEGDVLQLDETYPKRLKAVVVFVDGAFKFEWQDNKVTRYSPTGLEDFYVIGNVHENPELMK